MIESSVNIEGMEELKKQLKKLDRRVRNNIVRSGMRAGASLVRREARSRVPVDTGNLKKNIKVSSRKRGEKITAKVYIHQDGFYGRFIELGENPNQPARPFLRPAIDENQAQIIQAMKTKMWQRIRKEIAKR